MAATLTLICTRTCGTCRKAVALLEDQGVPYVYREYRDDPLDEGELRDVLAKLGVGPRAVLRPKEATAEGIDAATGDDELIARMAATPTLLQRPIAVRGERAVLGRPVEALAEFLGI